VVSRPHDALGVGGISQQQRARPRRAAFRRDAPCTGSAEQRGAQARRLFAVESTPPLAGTPCVPSAIAITTRGSVCMY